MIAQYTELVENTHAITRQLQLALNQVVNWTQETEFTFSCINTKTGHVCRVYGSIKLTLQLQLQNRLLPHLYEHKYLGMRVGKSLKCKNHIK